SISEEYAFIQSKAYAALRLDQAVFSNEDIINGRLALASLPLSDEIGAAIMRIAAFTRPKARSSDKFVRGSFGGLAQLHLEPSLRNLSQKTGRPRRRSAFPQSRQKVSASHPERGRFVWPVVNPRRHIHACMSAPTQCRHHTTHPSVPRRPDWCHFSRNFRQ